MIEKGNKVRKQGMKSRQILKIKIQHCFPHLSRQKTISSQKRFDSASHWFVV